MLPAQIEQLLPFAIAAGLLLWAWGQWRKRTALSQFGRLLAIVGVLLALYKATQGTGSSLSQLLLGGLLAAVLLWLFGLLAGVRTVRVAANAWFWPLLLVFVIRNFAWEPYRIPSGSMRPSLLPGDYVLVNRHVYGLHISALDWSLTRGEEPQRGDVVIFKHPQSGTVLIKRIVGLPGDDIKMQGITPIVNGEKLKTIPHYSQKGHPGYISYPEILGQHQYLVYCKVKNSKESFACNRKRTNKEWQVPENHYFVLGDNRDESADSRVWGTFPRELLLGRAEIIWMHWPPEQWPSFARSQPIP